MKRLTSILCCLVILFAGAAAVWADCARISFAPAGAHHSSPTSQHDHSHRSGSDHQHSHNSLIHCPTLDEFVPTATFSATNHLRIERAATLSLVGPVSRFVPQHFFRSHGPPGPIASARIPQYLMLSVLRV